MNGYVQSYLTTLEFKNWEKIEYFHSRIIGLQREIIFSRETVSPTRLLFQYTKSLSKRDKLKAVIATKMIDIITFIDKNWKYSVYKGEKIMYSIVI